MDIEDYPLNEGQYVKDVSAKTHVVWHGTMGRTVHTPFNGNPGKATSSIDWWNSDDQGRVGTTYLIDRSGTVYRCFEEKYWIFHLGLSGTNGKYDKSSVGIELANELNLIENDGSYYAFDKVHSSTKYEGPTFKRTWRGGVHWAALDEAQIDRAIELTLAICERHSIDPVFYYPSTIKDYPRCFTKATILCHSNCRADKKDLILEDWVWDKIKAAGIKLYQD